MNKRDFLSLLGAGVVAAPVAALTSRRSAEPVQSQKREESVLERIKRTGKLRCGYINYYPAFIRDPLTGQFEGMFFDLSEKMAKDIGIDLEWVEETTFDSMTAGVKNGRFDAVMSGIWPSASRAREVSFTESMFYSAVEAYVRADDQRFDEKLDLINHSKYKIATIDGEMSQAIAAEDFPQARAHSMPNSTDISQLLLSVTTKKADITFVETAVANDFLKKNPGSIRKVVVDKPARIFANTGLLPLGEPDLLNLFNVAQEQLLFSGYVEEIIHKYSNGKDDFYPVASPFQVPLGA